MSRENVEVVRRVQAEFERGNFWVPDSFDPSVRIVWLPFAGGEQETVGLEAMSWTLPRGKASGVFTNWRYASVWTLRDGKVTSVISYTDPAEALEAVGLSEQNAHADS